MKLSQKLLLNLPIHCPYMSCDRNERGNGYEVKPVKSVFWVNLKTVCNTTQKSIEYSNIESLRLVGKRENLNSILRLGCNLNIFCHQWRSRKLCTSIIEWNKKAHVCLNNYHEFTHLWRRKSARWYDHYIFSLRMKTFPDGCVFTSKYVFHPELSTEMRKKYSNGSPESRNKFVSVVTEMPLCVVRVSHWSHTSLLGEFCSRSKLS